MIFTKTDGIAAKFLVSWPHGGFPNLTVMGSPGFSIWKNNIVCWVSVAPHATPTSSRSVKLCPSNLPSQQHPRGVGGGGGGCTHYIFGLGCAARSWIPYCTLFQTKIYNFPYPISDLNLKMYPLFQTLWCMANRQLSIDLRRMWRPKRCSCFFFFAINVHGSTRYSKNGNPDQIDGIYSLFRTKMAKSTLFQTRNARKWYPLGRHIPIWLICGSTPPPPPPGPTSSHSVQLHPLQLPSPPPSVRVLTSPPPAQLLGLVWASLPVPLLDRVNLLVLQAPLIGSSHTGNKFFSKMTTFIRATVTLTDFIIIIKVCHSAPDGSILLKFGIPIFDVLFLVLRQFHSMLLSSMELQNG